jgi:mannitol/fructose-specific phosphotransferase system IIA component (Ntr-type)
VKLSALLPPAHVRVPLTARARLDAIDELLAVIPFEDADARVTAREAVLERERETSTGIGRGVAIPHGRTAAVDEHRCAIGIAPLGIDWEAIDGLPCRIVFLCLSEEHDAAEHVRVLSQFARVLNNAASRHALEIATTADEVRRVFLEDEEREGL